jgi:hypothetical protein
VREQRIGLEHHVDRPLVRRQRVQALAVEGDAAGWALEAGQAAQQGGLAAAGAAEQGEDLALADVQADVVTATKPSNSLRTSTMRT